MKSVISVRLVYHTNNFKNVKFFCVVYSRGMFERETDWLTVRECHQLDKK